MLEKNEVLFSTTFTLRLRIKCHFNWLHTVCQRSSYLVNLWIDLNSSLEIHSQNYSILHFSLLVSSLFLSTSRWLFVLKKEKLLKSWTHFLLVLTLWSWPTINEVAGYFSSWSREDSLATVNVCTYLMTFSFPETLLAEHISWWP